MRDWKAITKLAYGPGRSDEEYGRIVREYLRESCHVGFDGFVRRDRTGVARLLTDLGVFVEFYGDNDRAGVDPPSTRGPGGVPYRPRHPL